MNTGLELLLVALAAARVTTLLVDDRVLELPRGRLRAYAMRHGGDDGYLMYLTKCHLCAGWWVSLGWALAWLRWPLGTAHWAVPWAIAMFAWWTDGAWKREELDG